MENILDKNGKVIHTSKNLRGIRDYVGYSGDEIKTLDISEVGNKEGMLSILFISGNSYQTIFASFEVLKWWIYRMISFHDCTFLVNGENKGILNKKNSYFE